MRILLAALMLLGAAFAGCIDDADDRDGPSTTAGPGFHVVAPDQETDGLPDYRATPEVPSALELAISAEAPGGNGLFLWNDRAYVTTGNSEKGLVIFDITDPEAPVELGALEGQSARDVDILNYGDRIVAAVSAGGPLIFYDVTDPLEITELVRFDITSHTNVVHRPGKAVYNSRSLGDPPGGAEIYDATDPANIKLHKVWDFPRTAEDGTPVGNTGCHEVVVYAEQNRAYCAAVTQTLIWDVTDPLEPVILTAIDNPAINIHHQAFTLLDHTVLAIGDEYGGALLYACGPNQDTPVREVSAPVGAVWFYDLTTPTPTPLGYVSAPPAVEEAPSTCTAHLGSQVGDESSGFLTIGWYVAGQLLIDARDPTNPSIVSIYDEGGSVWEGRFYRGYVFGSTGGRGLDVLSVV